MSNSGTVYVQSNSAGSGAQLWVGSNTLLCQGNVGGCYTRFSDEGYIQDWNDGWLRFYGSFDFQNTLRTENNLQVAGATLATNGDLYMPWNGAWLSQRINQTVTTNSTPQFSRMYDDNSAYYIDSNVDSQMNQVYANQFIYRSDARLKDNVQPLDSGIMQLLKLKPVSFTWKSGSNEPAGKSDIGFIAQDLEKVFPNLVTTDENGYKGIDYVKLVPVLVKAVQDQQAEIDQLKAQVAALQK
jgi:hypothetical protein